MTSAKTKAIGFGDHKANANLCEKNNGWEELKEQQSLHEIRFFFPSVNETSDKLLQSQIISLKRMSC